MHERPGAGCRVQVIGTCNGSGRIVLRDPLAPREAPVPVDLDLETVLGLSLIHI